MPLPLINVELLHLPSMACPYTQNADDGFYPTNLSSGPVSPFSRTNEYSLWQYPTVADHTLLWVKVPLYKRLLPPNPGCPHSWVFFCLFVKPSETSARMAQSTAMLNFLFLQPRDLASVRWCPLGSFNTHRLSHPFLLPCPLCCTAQPPTSPTMDINPRTTQDVPLWP